MNTKKLIFLFITIALKTLLFGNDYGLQKDDHFSFSVKQIVYVDGEKYYSSKGSITYNEGKWYSDFSTSFFSNSIHKVEYNENEIIIYLQVQNFFNKGEPSFWDWKYPVVYKIILTRQIIEDIKTYEKMNKKSSYYYVYELPSDAKTTFGYANGICICNNLRVREDPNTKSSTKVITKLSKWEKVELIDCTTEVSKIDDLEYPWYKCKLKDGTVGWVFGGFVKIYFEDSDLNLLYKAFEKEGSEYTNQFRTPEEFY